MKFEDFLTLIKAGYTKEEIEKMGSGTAEETKADEKSEETKADETKAENVNANNDALLSDLLKEMKDIKKQLQNGAINKDSFSMSDSNKAQDILASIINPPTKEKEK